MNPQAPVIVFRVAAGPRVGFGHLVRCRSLARTMGVPPLVSLRGTRRTRERAAAMGWTVLEAAPLAADLVVIDDPVASQAAAWVARARHRGIPVASVHDLGLAHVPSDLLIDGSFGSHAVAPAASHGPARLCGPQFAILDPSIAAIRRQHRQPVTGRVLIALGGGRHVLGLARPLARAIAARAPGCDIRVVRGFAEGRSPALAAGRWVDAPQGLGDELADAQVVVTAGGVTLYEACALGVPVVGLPVTAAQALSIRAAACRGAALVAGHPPIDAQVMSSAADAVAALLRNATLRRRQSETARRHVDGEGAFRVAARLRELVVRRAA